MPGPKTHDIFHKDLERKLSKETLDILDNFDDYNVFSQGHDLFIYHNYYKLWNKKLLDSNIESAKLLQEEQFQEFVCNYMTYAKNNNLLEDKQVKNFIVGYIAHHILDAYTHPLIIYMSGDHTPNPLKETWEHGVAEKLIDSYLMLEKELKNPDTYKVYKDFHMKKAINKNLKKTISASMEYTYGIKNAGLIMGEACEQLESFIKNLKYDPKGVKKGIYKKIDPLFMGANSFSYNGKISDVKKYTNEEKAEWINPTFKDIKSNKSFFELYEDALNETVLITTKLCELFKKKNFSYQDIVELIPNYSSLHGQTENKKFELNNTKEEASEARKKITNKINRGIKINAPLHNKIRNGTLENFDSIKSMNVRKKIAPVIKFAIKKSMNKNNYIFKFTEDKEKNMVDIKECSSKECLKNLSKNKGYIFAPAHSFGEDFKATLTSLDRNVYAIAGIKDQFRINPETYIQYISGVIHVDKDSKQSRYETVPKAKKVLDNDNSLVIYPEGSFNHSENLLCLPLAKGFYKIAKETGKEVVPMVHISNYKQKGIITLIGDPINYSNFSEEDAIEHLEGTLATMTWYGFELCSEKHKRSSNPEIDRKKYLEDRVNEYLHVLWDPKSNWTEEEILNNKSKSESEKDILKDISNIDLNSLNLTSIRAVKSNLQEYYRLKEEEKYEINNFAKNNWNRLQDERFSKNKKK